ncbi:hypothetical protein TNCV_2558661 [Trichonephila clavipes]|nr:hypothetical protein TNCV_2558661 [Trichonephila clavipes]
MSTGQLIGGHKTRISPPPLPHHPSFQWRASKNKAPPSPRTLGAFNGTDGYFSAWNFLTPPDRINNCPPVNFWRRQTPLATLSRHLWTPPTPKKTLPLDQDGIGQSLATLLTSLSSVRTVSNLKKWREKTKKQCSARHFKGGPPVHPSKSETAQRSGPPLPIGWRRPRDMLIPRGGWSHGTVK